MKVVSIKKKWATLTKKEFLNDYLSCLNLRVELVNKLVNKILLLGVFQLFMN